MLPGIITVLDDEHFAKVTTLWHELKARFDVSLILNPMIPPHFSYHVAEAYEVDEVLGAMEKLARETAVFTLKTAGIGIFTATEPVIYNPVVTSPALSSLHQTLWQQIDPYATASQTYYAPQNWFPHITIAQEDVAAALLGDVICWLSEQPLHWEIQANNFTFVDEVGSANRKQYRFNFQE